MSRVTRLVKLAERLKESKDQSSDAVADLYRSTVVFLYASFEDMLKTTASIRLGDRPEVRTFGNVNAVAKLLQNLGLNLSPFQTLFPDMATLMSRRHRIVHEADLEAPSAVSDAPWTIGDGYQLIVWILVAVAFAARLRAELDPSEIVDKWYADERVEIIRKLKEARQSLAVRGSSAEEMARGLQAMSDTMDEILAILNRPAGETAQMIFARHDDTRQ